MLDQEWYTGKELLIPSYFPVDPISRSLAYEVCEAFAFYFNYNLTIENIKACHPLPNKKRFESHKCEIFKFLLHTRTKIGIDDVNLQLSKTTVSEFLSLNGSPNATKAFRDHAS